MDKRVVFYSHKNTQFSSHTVVCLFNAVVSLTLSIALTAYTSVLVT